VWVDWSVDDLDMVYRNNREAARIALERAIRHEPRKDVVGEAARSPYNPYYTPPAVDDRPGGAAAAGSPGPE
jgi:5,6,7,8-tetrahydromethanopterin hydro-lyase